MEDDEEEQVESSYAKDMLPRKEKEKMCGLLKLDTEGASLPGYRPSLAAIARTWAVPTRVCVCVSGPMGRPTVACNDNYI